MIILHSSLTITDNKYLNGAFSLPLAVRAVMAVSVQ